MRADAASCAGAGREWDVRVRRERGLDFVLGAGYQLACPLISGNFWRNLSRIFCGFRSEVLLERKVATVHRILPRHFEPTRWKADLLIRNRIGGKESLRIKGTPSGKGMGNFARGGIQSDLDLPSFFVGTQRTLEIDGLCHCYRLHEENHREYEERFHRENLSR